MELQNDFTVPCPVDEAWSVLTDVERIAPCMPGAQLTEVAGDDYHGTVKVKVGPITANYKGIATFAERHDDEHRAVLRAKGRDSRGAGTAEAFVTATLVPLSDAETRVEVATDLKVSGKVAQFGRGVMADVSAKLMDQFAANLAELLADEPGASGTEAAQPASAATTQTPRSEPAPVDLLGTAGLPVLRRVAPVVALVAALLLFRRLRRGRR
jgi:hypothetical protein